MLTSTNQIANIESKLLIIKQFNENGWCIIRDNFDRIQRDHAAGILDDGQHRTTIKSMSEEIDLYVDSLLPSSINRKKVMSDVFAVKQLGEQIGYGNMMALASGLWRALIAAETGGDAKTAAHIPTSYYLLTAEGRKVADKSIEVADQWVAEALKTTV